MVGYASEGFDFMSTKSINVRGYRVAVALKKYWGSIGMRLRYNEISIDIKDMNFPLAILSGSDITTFANHAVIPDSYYKNYTKMWKTQFRLSRFYLKFPMRVINGLRVYASEEHLPLYAAAIPGLSDLKKILSGCNASFPTIIMIKGEKISFYKDGSFLQNLVGGYLPDKHVIKIADTLISLVENMRNS